MLYYFWSKTTEKSVFDTYVKVAFKQKHKRGAKKMLLNKLESRGCWEGGWRHPIVKIKNATLLRFLKASFI